MPSSETPTVETDIKPFMVHRPMPWPVDCKHNVEVKQLARQIEMIERRIFWLEFAGCIAVGLIAVVQIVTLIAMRR